MRKLHHDLQNHNENCKFCKDLLLKASAFLKKASKSVWQSFEISCCCHEFHKIIVIYAGKRENKYHCQFEDEKVNVIPVELTYMQRAYKTLKNPLKALAAAVTIEHICELISALM